MDAIELQNLMAGPAPLPLAPVAPPQPEPKLEAPPFEGQLQRDTFVKAEVDGDEALRSFIERARTIAMVRGDGLRVPALPHDPRLASPLD